MNITLNLPQLGIGTIEELLPAFAEGGLYDELDHLIGEVVRRLDLAVEEDRDDDAGALVELLKDNDVDLDSLQLYRDPEEATKAWARAELAKNGGQA